MMKFVRKRTGELQKWNQNRITLAIAKAFKSTGEGDGVISREISDAVTERLYARFGDEGVPTVEEIQDLVILTIKDDGFYEVSEAYRLYRNERKATRRLSYLLETGDTIDAYVDRQTIAEEDGEKENANMSYSMQGLLIHLNTKVISPFWQMRIYTSEIRKALLGYELHIHDLGFLGPYCMGWSLQDWLWEGFPRGVRGQITAGPPKHFRSALDQLQGGYFMLQNDAAGAIAVSSVDTLLAPLINIDGLSYRQVYQAVEGFLFKMMETTRYGGQTPFTNASFDLVVPEFRREEHVIVGGKVTDFVYGDFQDEVDMFNRAFCELMSKGDATGRPFSFPIPTYNITKDFDWDFPELWEMTAKYGIPQFGNMITTGMKPEDGRSMCCNLWLDNALVRRGGGFFGANPLTGSIGVVTINLPRIGYDAKSDEGFFEKLEDLMRVARASLTLKRRAVEQYMERGLYPNSRYWLKRVKEATGTWWGNHFSTIGIVGVNEACLNYFGEDISSPQGHKFAVSILEFMRDVLEKYQNSDMVEEYPRVFWNLEATPAEGTSYKLAKADKERFPDIVVANEDYLRRGASPFYTNSTNLPVNHTLSMGEAIAHQNVLQKRYTGGTVYHNFMNESSPDPDGVAKFVRRFAETTEIQYFTITVTTSHCPVHGIMSGEFHECPTCGAGCEILSRIVGYIRPVENWNLGKQSEFAIRRTFGNIDLK